MVVKQWFLSILLESLNDASVPDDFKEFVKAHDMTNERVGKMIESNPRVLFDVFDNHALYIQVTGDNKSGWNWEVGPAVENAVCTSRKEADLAAIVEALKLLEEKL